MESRKLVDSVLLDLRKAFDLVEHDLLLSKIDKYHVTNTSQEWFKSYLSNRTQRCCINGSLSDALVLPEEFRKGQFWAQYYSRCTSTTFQLESPTQMLTYMQMTLNLVPRSHSVTGNVRSGKVRQYTIFHWPLKKGCGNAIYVPIGLFRGALNEGLVFASLCAVLNKYQLCGGKFCFFRRRKSFTVEENLFKNLRRLCKWYRRKPHVPCHSNKVLRSLLRGTQKLINSS